MSDHPSLADLDVASAFVDRHIGPDRTERATMLVVLWPGTRSIRMTSPPSASTMSWPTTLSRV